MSFTAWNLGGCSRRGLECRDLDHHSSLFLFSIQPLSMSIPCAWLLTPLGADLHPELDPLPRTILQRARFWTQLRNNARWFYIFCKELQSGREVERTSTIRMHSSQAYFHTINESHFFFRKCRVKPVQWGGFQEFSQICHLGPGEAFNEAKRWKFGWKLVFSWVPHRRVLRRQSRLTFTWRGSSWSRHDIKLSFWSRRDVSCYVWYYNI